MRFSIKTKIKYSSLHPRFLQILWPKHHSSLRLSNTYKDNMAYFKDLVNRIGAIFNLPPFLTSHIQPEDLLWIHDTTAFGVDGGYEAEFLASFFYRNSSEVSYRTTRLLNTSTNYFGAHTNMFPNHNRKSQMVSQRSSPNAAWIQMTKKLDKLSKHESKLF